MSDLEKYNRTGLRDGYNVLKHLESLKHESNPRKGGDRMEEEKKPITQESEAAAQAEAADSMPAPASMPPEEDPDLKEPEEGEEMSEV